MWEWDEIIGEYYFYVFCKEQFDFNWENFVVCVVVYDIMCFWFDCGIDGFCFDVINFISKDFVFFDLD